VIGFFNPFSLILFLLSIYFLIHQFYFYERITSRIFLLITIISKIIIVINKTSISQNSTMVIHFNGGSALTFPTAEVSKITFSGITGTKEMGKIISSLNHFKCYSNPFSDNITLEYTLPEKGMVEITISNLKGNYLEVLYLGGQNPVLQELCTNPADTRLSCLSSGI
jgi:hypothetical protein